MMFVANHVSKDYVSKSHVSKGYRWCALLFTVLGSWSGFSSAQADTLAVEITAYSSSVAQTDDAPTITASGAVASPGIVAVSRDLLERFPYGSEVDIISVSGQGCGGWVPETPLTVADTMNVRITKHLDIWLKTTEQALNWGRCQGKIRAVQPAAK